MNTEKQEFERFIEAVLQAKFQKAYSDEDIIDVAAELVQSGNPYAKAAIEKLTSEYSPQEVRGSAFWSKAESMGMIDIATVPRPTPSKQDEHGLWRDDVYKAQFNEES